MATGPQAVERVAQATGEPVVTVDRVARVLKQHTPALWARSPSGGGIRSEHVGIGHLVNLLLGFAAVTPYTHAAKGVALWRDMTPRAEWRPVEPFSQVEQLLLGVLGEQGRLGDVLERLVGLVTDNPSALADILYPSVFQVELILNPRFPAALISFLHPLTFGEKSATKLLYLPREFQLDRALPLSFLPAEVEAPIVQVARLSLGLFGVLGELWADSKRHIATETAALLSKSAAVRHDQHVAKHARADRSPPLTRSDQNAGRGSVSPY